MARRQWNYNKVWVARGFIAETRSRVYLGSFATEVEAKAAEEAWWARRGGRKATNASWIQEQRKTA